MEGKYASQVLISASQATRTSVYKVQTHSGQFLCFKKQVFSTAIARNDAYLHHALQQVLVHQYICKTYESEIGENEDGHYLLTETEWAGEDLDQVAQRKQRIQEAWTDVDCLLLLSAVVDALAFAERRGICHRDLKPMNLFLSQDGCYRVGDFGNAKSAEQKAGIHTIAGTPIYLSPQLREAYLKQLMGEEHDGTVYDPFKSDVFSLGLSVVFLLAPELVTMFGNQGELMKRVTTLRIGGKLKDLLECMLESEEAKRPDFLQLEAKMMAVKSEVLLRTANSLVQTGSGEDSRAAVSLLFNHPSELYVKSELHDSELSQRTPSIGQLRLEPSFITNFSPPTNTVSYSPRSVPLSPGSDQLPDTSDFSEKSPSEKPKKRFRIIKKPQIPEKSEEDSHLKLQFQESESALFPEEKTCQICSSKFINNATEPWRLNLIGSALAQEMVSICSEECKNRYISKSSPVVRPPDSSSQDSFKACQECGVVSDQYYFLHCRKHVICAGHRRQDDFQISPSLFQQCRSCSLGVSEQELGGRVIYQNNVDECVGFLARRDSARTETKPIFVPISMLLILELNKGECHFCQSVLKRDWRFLSHNQHPAVACSKDCIRRSLRPDSSRKDFLCPMCANVIEGERVSYVLSEAHQLSTFLIYNQDTDCSLCRFRKTDLSFPCGHQTCSECLRTTFKPSARDDFPCVRCGLACDKASYVETLDLLHLI